MIDKIKRLKDILHSKKESERDLKGDNFEWTQQGINLFELGKYKEAIKAFDKALNIRDDDIVTYLLKGDALCKLGEYKESLSCFNRALELGKKNFDSNPALIAKIKTHEAKLYDNIGNYNEALRNYNEALEILVQVDGYNNATVARILKYTARTYTNLGSNQEALISYKESLSIFEKILGYNHPEVVKVIMDIADIYKIEGKNEQAISYYQDALNISENTFGHYHLETVEILKESAEAYKIVNDHEKAVSNYKDALVIVREILGNGHVEVAKITIHLAEVYKELADYEEALSNLTDALKILEATLGTENQEVVKCLLDIASVYEKMERYEDAISVLTRIIRIYEKFPMYENQVTELSNRILEYLRCQNKKQMFMQYETFGMESNCPPFGKQDVSLKLGSLKNYLDWEDLHKLTLDNDKEVRYFATFSISNIWPNISDKSKAWKDLHRLTGDNEKEIRYASASSIGSVFAEIPNKKEAWEDLVKLSNDMDISVQKAAVSSLVSASSYVSEKQQVWKDLNKLMYKQDSSSRYIAAKGLASIFSQVPNKIDAWEDLHKLIEDKDKDIQYIVISSLGEIFYNIPNRQEAWEDLRNSIKSENKNLQIGALSSLTSAFIYLPDKKKAWKDLIQLANSEYSNVRKIASSYLVSSFEYIEDRQEAWNDLFELTASMDNYVKRQVMSSLGLAFANIPDKQTAWKDLYSLKNNEYSYVRWKAASLLGSAFAYVPDRQMAWNDLHELTSDQDSYVKYGAANSIGSAFEHIPDKQMAWNDLHKLTNDQDNYVRCEAASAIGSAFEYILDKQMAWNDLHELTKNGNELVRAGAYHSLGKICIYKSSQSENEEKYREELENAIKFFEKSSKESESYNPSQFCLPFYRSFHTIIFKRQAAKEEVNKYLTEAREAVKGSKSKKLLLEVVENLTNALKEVQNLEYLDLDTKKVELNFYRKYCENAAEKMRSTEKTAPSATSAMRKGLPLLDTNLKNVIEEIQDKAKIACRESKGTDAGKIACSVNQEIQKWEIGNQEEMTQKIEDLIFALRMKIPPIPENKHILENIENLRNERDLSNQFNSLGIIISSIPIVKTVVSIDTENDSNLLINPTIGIVTSLPKEYSAVKMMLDNPRDYKVEGKLTGRIYSIGEIPKKDGGKHSIVLSLVGMGNNISVNDTSTLIEQFKSIKYILVVGIAGGIRNSRKVDDQVRLGDIVVSNEIVTIQNDLIKNDIHQVMYGNKLSSASLLEAVRRLQAKESIGNHIWYKYIDQALSKLRITHPSEDAHIMQHPKIPKAKVQPRVFIGPIASVNRPLKYEKEVCELKDRFDFIAIEMEALGIADATWNHEVEYLVVKGICDYCDSHKNDDWQQYAAVVAAAYTRALIESMP